ncbi:MAG: hypothetical protein RLZZ496_1140, partial [Pseudomonadota bacterium]
MNGNALPLTIGVDGGGTRCRVRIRNSAGHICAEGEAGPSNIHSDFDAAIIEIRKALDQALGKINDSATVRANASLGLG